MSIELLPRRQSGSFLSEYLLPGLRLALIITAQLEQGKAVYNSGPIPPVRPDTDAMSDLSRKISELACSVPDT